MRYKRGKRFSAVSYKHDSQAEQNSDPGMYNVSPADSFEGAHFQNGLGEGGKRQGRNESESGDTGGHDPGRGIYVHVRGFEGDPAAVQSPLLTGRSNHMVNRTVAKLHHHGGQ